MESSLVDEFNDILKSLDDLSPDKIQLFTVKIVQLFRKVHARAEFGTEKEKKEALEFAGHMQESFGKLESKLSKNPAVDTGQFQHLFAFMEDDIKGLAERRKSSIYLEQPAKGHKKKKVIKKV